MLSQRRQLGSASRDQRSFQTKGVLRSPTRLPANSSGREKRPCGECGKIGLIRRIASRAVFVLPAAPIARDSCVPAGRRWPDNLHLSQATRVFLAPRRPLAIQSLQQRYDNSPRTSERLPQLAHGCRSVFRNELDHLRVHAPKTLAQ